MHQQISQFAVSLSVSQSISQSFASQPVSHSGSQSVSQSVSQSISQWVCISQSVSQCTVSQSVRVISVPSSERTVFRPKRQTSNVTVWLTSGGTLFHLECCDTGMWDWRVSWVYKNWRNLIFTDRLSPAHDRTIAASEKVKGKVSSCRWH